MMYYHSNSTAFNVVTCIAILNLRPEIFHSVKFGDEAKVGLPCFAFVVLEKPKSPPGNQRRGTVDKLHVAQ